MHLVLFCSSTIPKHLSCSLKICYAVHEIIYTEQHTKLIVLCFFVCDVGRISRLWERRSPWVSSSLPIEIVLCVTLPLKSFSAFNFVANFFLCTIFFLLISAKEKNGQKQVKKKAFKINAKFEDAGLND